MQLCSIRQRSKRTARRPTLRIERVNFGCSLKISASLFLGAVLSKIVKLAIVCKFIVAANFDDILMVRVLWAVFLLLHQVFIATLRISDKLEKSFAITLDFIGVYAWDLKQFAFIYSVMNIRITLKNWFTYLCRN